LLTLCIIPLNKPDVRITENKAICNLISIMLKDSVNIQEMDAR
jgi:hypothetical protein